jgi:DNA-binding NtrC family response regulator
MRQTKSILVIDDEDSICLAFRRFFEGRGWEVRAAASADEGLAAYLQSPASVVFLDVRLPDRSGLDLLGELASNNADVVMITAYGGLDTVVRAIQGKAYDYLVKPLDLDKALALANRIWQTHAAPGASGAGPSAESRGILIGNSPPMQEVYKLIARATASSSPVLIQGETGTGKELVARAIHQFSLRRDGPFMAINCGAIPSSLIESELFGHVRGAFTGAEADRAGKFESADRGCLLLDEICELPLAVQVKLLRVLDTGIIERVGASRPVRLDVRILAATNKNLADEVQHGRFRQDLYYRLAVLHISLPPLRERKDDIPLLAEHFLRVASGVDAAPQSLSAGAVKAMVTHQWPGNVRELKNAIEHAAAVAPGRAVLEEDLPESVSRGQSAQERHECALHKAVVEYATRVAADAGRYSRTLEEAERALIVYAMNRHQGNQSEAAAYLGLHRNTLRNKLRQLCVGAWDGDKQHDALDKSRDSRGTP